MKNSSIYQNLSHQYDVNKVFKDWFGNFDELEKNDLWRTLTSEEQTQAVLAEHARKLGKNVKKSVDLDVFKRAFDDCTDPENIGIIP